MSKDTRLRRLGLNTGFTIVELVIALSLLALIMLGLVSAMRGFAQTGVRMEASAQSGDQLRLLPGFLRRTISTAVHRVVPDERDGILNSLFIGDSNQLTWVGNMPGRHGAGGLSHMRLSVRGDPDGADLMLQFAPFDPLQSMPDWSSASEVTLVEEVSSFALSYRALGEEGWMADWPRTAHLPGLISIGLTVRGKPWPSLVIGLGHSRVGNSIQ